MQWLEDDNPYGYRHSPVYKFVGRDCGEQRHQPSKRRCRAWQYRANRCGAYQIASSMSRFLIPESNLAYMSLVHLELPSSLCLEGQGADVVRLAAEEQRGSEQVTN